MDDKQHQMTSHGGSHCVCGEWLYEDNKGQVYCTVGGRVDSYELTLRKSKEG